MAVEVASQSYGYLFELSLPKTPVRERYPALRARFEKRAAEIAFCDSTDMLSLPETRGSSEPTTDILCFRYNPLHDLESLW